MTKPAPLPGGPLHPEFRETIQDLAKQAQEEDRCAEEEARKQRRHQSFSRFVGVGLFLIAVELASLVVLSNRNQPGVVARKVVTRSKFAPDTCNALVFRTYWQVAKYVKETEHPPASLSDLIPKYLDKLPSDPVSGKPLEYSTDGNKFQLNCPGARTAGR